MQSSQTLKQKGWVCQYHQPQQQLPNVENFSSESITLEEIEIIFLSDAQDRKLHSIITNPHEKKHNLKTLHITRTRKKVVGKLVNCLLLTKHHDSKHKHNDINQPLKSIPIEDI